MQQGIPIRKILLALLLMILTYLVMALALRMVGLENAQNYIQRAGIWGPLMFTALCAISLILAPLSSGSVFMIGGVLFDKGTGFFLSLIATLAGCNINYWLSRHFGRQVVGRFIGHSNLDQLDRITQQLKSHHSVVYMTLIMPLAQDTVSYAVGLTKVRYVDFFIALAISSPITIGFYVFLGTSLLEAIL